MKTTTRHIAMLMVAALCFCFAGCGASEAEKQREAEQYEAERVEQIIVEILSITPACNGWAPSVVDMVNIVFHDYEWSFKQQSGNENRYIVTFTGSYSPNPDLPFLSQSGTIDYVVDIQSYETDILNDPSGISSTFLVYIVN